MVRENRALLLFNSFVFQNNATRFRSKHRVFQKQNSGINYQKSWRFKS